ncbi:hypothetical protein BKA82DRAFT_947392 [Pisolithus tinctorius]|nr:hypothetical protein BKA82DRAFT_947392 [Pisolithus tinctorius]
MNRGTTSHTPLAPMDVNRPHHHDFSGPSRDSVGHGPASHPCLLLHHPVPQQQLSTEELRSSANQDLAQHLEYFNCPLRVPSGSASPAPHPTCPRSPVSTFPAYPPPSCQPIEPAQPSIPASQRTPPSYPHELRAADHDMAWDCCGPHPEHHRDWEDRNHRGRSEYLTHPSQQPYYASHALSPMETLPRSAHHLRPHWDSKPPGGPSTFGSSRKQALALQSCQIRHARTSGGARCSTSCSATYKYSHVYVSRAFISRLKEQEEAATTSEGQGFRHTKYQWVDP